MYCDGCSMALNDEALKNIKILEDALKNPDTLIDYAYFLKAREEKMG